MSEQGVGGGEGMGLMDFLFLVPHKVQAMEMPILPSSLPPYLLPCKEARSHESSTAISGVFLNSSLNTWTPIAGHCIKPHSSHPGTPFR